MVGDLTDVFGRLKRWLPNWFGQYRQDTPVLDSLLQAPATVLSYVYSLYVYAKLQTRIATATDGFLDLIAADFFGTAVRRSSGQSDDSFRVVIRNNLMQPRGTRQALISAIEELTGVEPVIFEPGLITDCGAMSVSAFCGNARMGSLACGFKALVTLPQTPITGGLTGAAFCGAPSWSAMREPLSRGYMNSISLQNGISRDDIFAVVNALRPVATEIGVTANDNGLAPPPLVFVGNGPILFQGTGTIILN